MTGIYAGTPTNYASGILYASHGAISQMSMRNGLMLETRSYSTDRQQLTSLNAGGLLSLSYFYCPFGATSCTTNNGNVLRHQVGNLVQNFGYVESNGMKLNRLTSAIESGGANEWSQTYAYDASGYGPYGNRWVTSGSTILNAGLTPTSSSNFDAKNRLQLNNSSYDNAGNQMQIGGYSFTYDAENRLASSTLNTTTTYTYDGDGHRVLKTTPTTQTVYVYDAMGELAAEYSTGAVTSPPCLTCYLTTDALGSTRMVTDQNGTPQAYHDFLPFGEEIPSGMGGRSSLYGSSDGIAQKFTAKERDAESGLDFFGARYMSSGQGRFSNPDPVTGTLLHAVNPQRWNMYTYAMNNPLSYFDPDGRDVIYVNFSKEVSFSLFYLPPIGMGGAGTIDIDIGHAGIITVNDSGGATFSRFGSTNEPALYGQGQLRTYNLESQVQFNSNRLPTDLSYRSLANEVARIEGQDPATVRMNYFRTSPTDTRGLENAIQRFKEASDRGKAPLYVATSQNCAAYACRALISGNAIPENARISLNPTNLFSILSLIANENYSNGNRSKPKQPTACTSASDSQGNTLPKVCE